MTCRFQYDQYVQAQDGYDLVLTIDETAQSIVEKASAGGPWGLRRAGGRHGRFDERQDRRDFGAFHKGRLRPERPIHHFAGGRRRHPEKVEDALQKAQEKEQQELNTLQLAIDNAETDEARAEAKKALADYERIDVTTLRDELTDKCGPKHRISSGETKPSVIPTTPVPFSKWSRAPWRWNPA